MVTRARSDFSFNHTLWRCALISVFTVVTPLIVRGEGEPKSGASAKTSIGLPLPPRSIGPDSMESTRRKSVSNSHGLWTTAIVLSAVVGGIVVVGRLMRPYMAVPRTLPVEAFELLGQRMIEPKLSIQLVRCGGKVLVLGVSSNDVRTLSEITDLEEVDRLTEACRNLDEQPNNPKHSRRDSQRFRAPMGSGSAEHA